MRESRDFAKRTKVLESDEVRRKYILVFEGQNTERIYFEAVERNRQNLKINPLIDIVPLLRSYDEEGWSNPRKILDRVLDHIAEHKTGTISYSTFLQRIMDCLIEEKLVSNDRNARTYIWGQMRNACLAKFQVILEADVSDIEATYNLVIEVLKKSCKIDNVINIIPEFLKEYDFTYEVDFDKICFIVDRDRKSFKSDDENNQYMYVLNKCKEKGFGFFLSNPCFEFWLLMHFDEVCKLNKEKLLDNVQVTRECKYAEYELKKLLPGYTKSSYDADLLINYIDKAMLNEKLYCEDIDNIEHELGSRVGLLIEELRE